MTSQKCQEIQFKKCLWDSGATGNGRPMAIMRSPWLHAVKSVNETTTNVPRMASFFCWQDLITVNQLVVLWNKHFQASLQFNVDEAPHVMHKTQANGLKALSTGLILRIPAAVFFFFLIYRVYILQWYLSSSWQISEAIPVLGKSNNRDILFTGEKTQYAGLC